MSIRLKVILPYLLLTVVVSVIGVYVVTRLVAGSVQERLTNQLLEAGRAVSDNFARQEIRHVEYARIFAFTTGLTDSMLTEDHETAMGLAEPLFAGLRVENLILISPQGREVAHLLLDEQKNPMQVSGDTGAGGSLLVTAYLEDRDLEAEPRRALGFNHVDDGTYYYTVIPVATANGRFAGVIMIGTSIQSILPVLKSNSLADVVIYGGNGQAIGTTLGSADRTALAAVSISEEDYAQLIVSEDIVTGRNVEVGGRSYSVAHGPLQIGSDRIGVFAVALPLDYVISSGEVSRTTYMVLFTLVFFFVLVIGFVVSRLIINPLYSLVNTSQAIAGGDLEKRTGISTKDEIGTLASTFDTMTARLQERTRELEHKNEILHNMDKMKTNFIQVSAHELRTPLTVIMGYSQMLEMDTKHDPELNSMVQGILEGSERMTGIVESMLDVSRIDSNTLSIRKTNLRFEKVLDKVVKEFDKALIERKIKMDVQGIHELPSVPGDRELIAKVFHHIVMNAIKFTPDGGQITVSGRYLNGKEPPSVEITVRDTGIGIDSSMHKTIFEKFGQAGDYLMHSSGRTKFKGGGPGLGLAIARGIVEAHGGRIWVESAGHDETSFPGSAFFVVLPVLKQTGELS